MLRSRHIPAQQLALFPSGDLGFWSSLCVKKHIARCDECAIAVDQYARLRLESAQAREERPLAISGASWQALASEMTANIRLGLSAGECVSRAPVHHRRPRLALVAIAVALAIVCTEPLWLKTIKWPRATSHVQTNFPGEVSKNSGPSLSGPSLEVSGSRLLVRAPGREFSFLPPTGQTVSHALSPGGVGSRYTDDSGVTIVNVDAE